MEEYQKLIRGIWKELASCLKEKDELYEEIKKLKEENRELRAIEHRNKGVLPMLEKAVYLYMQTGKVSDELYHHIKELHQEQQISESSLEKNNRVLPSTGYLPLDFQLTDYLREAKEKNIDFNIAVCDKISYLIDHKMISGLELLNLTGCLIRNAFHAVLEKEESEKRIFLSFGYLKVNHAYHIDIFDNGVYFPEEILNHLGERGNSTRGSGNGYADIIEILRKNEAALSIEEYDHAGWSFTKCIGVSFCNQYSLKINLPESWKQKKVGK